MSSNEDEYNEGENSSGAYHGLKKRRIQRACDICRRKKIRCDGVQMPGNRCSNCISYSFDCTYNEAAKKRGPPKGYVESLENRLEKLDRLLRRLCPDESLYKELNRSLEKDSWNFEQDPVNPSSLVSGQAFSRKFSPTPLESVTSAIRSTSNTHMNPHHDLNDDDDSTLILADNLKRMALDPHEYRFFGKSSGAMLIQTAIELKNEYSGVEKDRDLKKPIMWKQRSEFWALRPWERETYERKESPVFTFPEPDLAADLIGLYFDNMNLYLPLLHRPAFEKSIQEDLHLTNDSFAVVYLLVCAVGSRFSSDPRVLLDGVDSLHSCGWKWFDQVQRVKRSLLLPPSLHDLQFYCLSVQFLQGSSAPQSCWTMVGIGIRLAQDVGAHRRKIHTHTLTPEDELWKRAFWVLVCMDRMVSAALGRPCAIQDEDFDVDMPVECDDEYWDNSDPEKRFKQPPNKPSLMTAFILHLKLNQVLAFSLRTIYSINKSKILLGFVGQQWEQHIVAELDSALNKWVDSVPDHLRWDPKREDNKFFNQSVSLYAAYYHIQILIHRPFIPSPSKPSPLSFPSLAICTNAARSCSHVVDIQRRRNPLLPPQIHMPAFTSGIVLLLNIWGGKRSGLSTDPNKEMADVHKCMQVLRQSEERWHSAGRLWDILYELASVGELPLPQPSPPSTNKRERGSETPISATPESSQSMEQSDIPRNIAGSRRFNKDSSLSARTSQSQLRPPPPQQPQQQQPPSISLTSQTLHQPPPPTDSKPRIPKTPAIPSLPHPPTELFTLPVYSDELGRLPLHGQLTFSAQPHTQQHGPAPASQPLALNQGDFWYNANPSSSGEGGEEPILLSSTSTNANASSSASVPHTHQHQHTGHHHHQHQSHQHTQDGHMSTVHAPLPEMSSMTQGYGFDAVSMAGGMSMFDNISPSGYISPQGSYASIGQMDTAESLAGMGNVYGGGLSMDTRHDRHLQHGQPQSDQEQQQAMPYAFVDSDTIAMWSSAPTGFELDEWGTYLTNVSELTHAQNQLTTSGSGGLDEMHGHHPGQG